MGRGGTCNHCGNHFILPAAWRFRLKRACAIAKRNGLPATLWIAQLPFRLLSHLAIVNSRPDDLEGLSQAERLMVLEARKQTKIQRANRSDTSCCLGCIIVLLILILTGAFGPLLAIIGIGGAIASQ